MKLDRLLGILTTLLQNDRVTAAYLAEKYEVTRRTIGRDIDALCRAGIPIVTRQGGGGGISIADGYKLDKSVLTTDELTSIIAALKGLGSVSEKTGVERTLDKLSPNKDKVVSLQESIVIDLASHYKGSLTGKIELIKRAVREHKIIKFDYYYEKGMTKRYIEPYFIMFQWSDWYVFGYCGERLDWRLFKLSRLWELVMCEEEFRPRDIPPEKRDFTALFTDNNKLVALFDPSVRYQLIDAYGLDCYTETEEGMLRFDGGFTNRDFTLNWLLGFGDKVKVLEPADMAEEILEIAKKIVACYEGT